MGGFETLCARVEQLEQELTQLQFREQALILAREALEQANSRMAQVYAPQLTGIAAGHLSRLTAGRYHGLVISEDLELSVLEAASGLVRPLAALSRGTQDQTWLALRLAMTELLLPEGTPLVLDDALLTFDEARERSALALLKAQNRQILVFSCK